MRRPLVSALAACGLAAAGMIVAASPTTADEVTEQWRGYWVDAFHDGIYTPQQVSALVTDAAELNANALIVQIARRYDCFCNRALYPRTDAAIAPAPYDPLDEVIDQAHAAGIEVHAWINVGTMWNSTTPHSSPDHAFNQHGPSATGADRWLNKRVDGAELMGANAYIDPANPAAVDYIVEAISSIVREYDVDGINLDYIRYPDFNAAIGQNDWGYSEVSLARFHSATGRSDVPAPTDQQFSDWRRDQISSLVRKMYLSVYAIDSQVRLTNDAITYSYGPQTMGGWEQTRPYAEVMQDWKGWLDEGIIDTVIAMNYKRDWMPDQAQMYDEWTEVLADWQGDRQAVDGTALYLNNVEDSLAQVRDTLAATTAGNTVAGWTGYSYASPSLTGTGAPPDVTDAERDVLVAALTTGAHAPFADQAAVPSMPWKEHPSDGHVAGVVGLLDGTALDQVEVTLDPIFPHGDERTQVSDGSGWFGFVDVPPGLYFVRPDFPDGVIGQPLVVVRVAAGEIADADLTRLIRLPR